MKGIHIKDFSHNSCFPLGLSSWVFTISLLEMKIKPVFEILINILLREYYNWGSYLQSTAQDTTFDVDKDDFLEKIFTSRRAIDDFQEDRTRGKWELDGFSLDGATDEGVTQLSSISIKSVKLLKMHKKFSKFLEKLFLLVYDQGKIIPARKSASRLIKLIFSQTSAAHCCSSLFLINFLG